MEVKKLTTRKVKMTQVFQDDGAVVPATILVTIDEITPEMEAQIVEVVGQSKGKGFTGVMKKWNFKGAQATRGQSDKPRAAGSIGAQTPSKVFKGKKMAGRHGNKKVTLKNRKIVKVDLENKHIYISGPVPGATNSEVLVKFN